MGTTQQYAHLTGSSLRATVEEAWDGESEVERLRAEVARLTEENAQLQARLEQVLAA